jgi:hypothetical protein
VVIEKFETAIQIFSMLLHRFDIPPEVIMEQQEIIRRECCKIFQQLPSLQETVAKPEEKKTFDEPVSQESRIRA